ncbi:MAG: lipid II:glycine glycyltransferase FemX [Myxococcota bacterium]
MKMSPSDDIIDPVDTDFWREVAEECEHATFFHSPLWHRVMEITFEDRVDRSVGAVFDNGTRAVFPMAELPANVPLVLRNFMSTHLFCYGGPISDGPIPAGGIAKMLGAFPRKRAYRIEIMGNPLDLHLSFDGYESEEDFTHILELDRNWDDVFSDFSRGHRSSYRKAKKKNVEVRRGGSAADWDAYYGAYEASLERWGDDVSSVHPRGLFDALHEVSREHPENIQLWLAEVDGDLASGAIVFYWNRHVDYWHGAAHEEYFDHRPNNLLHGEIIEDAIERGFDYYDFNPSGGHEGVANFKSRFGADKKHFNRWCYKNPVADGFESVKDRILKKDD